MNELIKWLEANKISYRILDNEVVEIEEFGKMFCADLSGVNSIFRNENENLKFNLMENEKVLIEEGINYVAFPFGKNWYFYDIREGFRFNILKYVGKRKPTISKVKFVNLGVHTPYELLNGAGDLAVWIKKATYLGHDAIGICDRNTMAGTLNLQKECAKANITPVFGYSFKLDDEEEKVDMKIYCQSQKGLKNLLRIQKEVMVDSPNQTLSLEGLMKYGEGNVLVLGKLSSFWIEKNVFLIDSLSEIFDKVYYQVDLSEYKADRIDTEVLKATSHFFHTFYLPDISSFLVEPILICDNYYPDKDDARSKLILNKIASGAAHRQSEDQYFKDVDEHLATLTPLFHEDWNIEDLFERMCSHTVEIAKNAKARFVTGKMYMPEYMMQDEERKRYGNRHKMFLGLIEEGLFAKIPVREHEKYRSRLKEEIYIIESTNNVDYFLIQWDMIKEARKRGIVTGIGRGSAGGSLVSYLLDIISIDPIKYELMFSRFLVPERCGLNWVDAITAFGDRLIIPQGKKYVELIIDGERWKVDTDAQFRIIRSGKEITVYADELRPDDKLLIDQRDLLWTLKELLNEGRENRG